MALPFYVGSALVAALALLASACGSTPAVLPVNEVRCYAGTSQLHMAGGAALPAGNVIARRTLSPAKGTIVEEVVVPGGRPGVIAREFVVDMTVMGTTVTLSERSGAFSGTGELSGPAWAWTSWRTESRLPSGARVVSADKLDGNTLTVEKQVYGPNGKVQVSMTERYHEVTDAEFEEARARMLAAESADSLIRLMRDTHAPPM